MSHFSCQGSWLVRALSTAGGQRGTLRLGTKRYARRAKALQAEICLGSGLTQHVATGVHKPAAEDQYAPVFVSSAIAQLLCEDMETLGQLSAYEPLTTFEQEQQKLKPCGVVWVNSDPLDL
jgi:hypothetical protein